MTSLKDTDNRLDEILKLNCAACNVQDKDGNRFYDFDFTQAKAELKALIREELKSLLTIPTKYIDDDTIVYWSDFNADVLANIIEDRLKELS